MFNLPQFIVRRFSTTYLRFIEKVASVSIEGLDNYERSLKGFKEGKHNLILPFRHVAKADAPVLGALFGRLLPVMRKKNPFYFWIHFLFGDMVLDWAGAGARWLFPQVGAVPVSNQKVVKEQVLRIREIVTSGDKPLCMAPEGQVNYYNEKCGDLTGGLTHFIRWSQKAGKDIVVQPLKVHYIFGKNESLYEMVVSRFAEIGIDIEFKGAAGIFLDEAIIKLMEYLHDYLCGDSPGAKPSFECEEEMLPAIQKLLISSADTRYGIGTGRRLLDSVLMFRNYVFEDLRNSGMSVPQIMRKIKMTWRAPSSMTELMRLYQHQQLLDVLTNFDFSYHRDGDENREMEQSLFLLDIINRLKGGDINTRYFPGQTTAVVRFGEPLCIRPEDDPSIWKTLFQNSTAIPVLNSI